jgi:hypothetical protein
MRKTSSRATLIADLDIWLIEWFMDVLGIQTGLLLSSRLEQPGRRTELLANICESLGAKQYLSPLGSSVYLLQDIHVLLEKDIDVVFQQYEHPPYGQLFRPFCPYASILDLIFNEGERALEALRSGRRTPFLPHEISDMLSVMREHDDH